MVQSFAIAVQSTVPISQCSRCLAGEMIPEVKSADPEALLKSDEADAVLLSLAEERMSHAGFK